MMRWLLVLSMLGLLTGRGAASELSDFARCVRQAGATYYTASWCPHCARQNEMFGNALRYLRTVDCTDGCNGIASFPTWTFADGSRLSGVATFDVLTSRTGCRLGEPADDGRDQVLDGGVRERFVGGAKIIEIPSR